ncbi:hypothetical protein [Kangiella koreensis]|uniref:Uncharacterized protein n=1 Tax=Kangiella koreensis (strain DSM 16069 / JCM 12317 / KCTC 12182 / SW-125) TaxID=523791 RepID=C7RBF8_KANKD|nr:hypothetical protein [Kangiella koreensis]ACV26600.1 hypothetical protein Kkor_1181 [Kangiella koreensis DSM 16069]
MERRHLILTFLVLHIVFYGIGFYMAIFLSKYSWQILLVSFVVIALSYKYNFIFQWLRDKPEPTFEVIDPNEHINVNDAIDRYKAAERIRRQNSKWYEFWSWS